MLMDERLQCEQQHILVIKDATTRTTLVTEVLKIITQKKQRRDIIQ